MKYFETLLPVATLVLGWCLNSATAILQEWRENRKALAKAIADLLEIRHDLQARRTAMEALKQLGKLNPHQERFAWNLIAKVLPQSDDMSKRYNEAVTLIASFDPLLGFQLRSKDFITKVGATFSQFEGQVGQPVPMISELEYELYRIAMPYIDDVIVDLSKKHGFRTRLGVKRYITNSKQMEVPKELNHLLASVKTQLEQAKNTETKTPCGNQSANIQNDC